MIRRILVPLALFVCSSFSTSAQVCTDVSGIPGLPTYTPVAGAIPRPANCVALLFCYEAIPTAPAYSLSPGGCDPQLTSCTATVQVDSDFPGNAQNYGSGAPNPADSMVKLLWSNQLGQLTGICGTAAGKILDDQGIAGLQVGFSCASAAANPRLYQFELAIDTCEGGGGTCPKQKKVNVDFLAASGFCPELPAEEDCADESSCNACKSSGAPLGGGKASAAGGGGMAGGTGTGPGARLRYKAGGAGMIGHPGAVAWRADLGLFWSHDYAQRLFVDPAPAPFVSRVYQVTRSASYVTWGDADGDGVYESRQPASGYQRLAGVPGGWELRDLDGTLTFFDTAGRWLSESDRFGNTKAAIYAAGKLTAVDFPDQRREAFTYHGSGKLATITEHGVDGFTSRTWAYTWSGDLLTRIDLPDGRALVYVYGDLGHPGYLTRSKLIATNAAERITAAFDYDPSGNVIRLWRGADTFASGVDRWQFAFDDPSLPRVVTVTDPLGDIATYTFDSVRTARNAKAKLVKLEGDCPSCGTGPNSELVYGDAANPFRPTTITNGRGIVIRMSYDADGRLTERIEAFGTALERATSFEWHPSYPALLVASEQPSTTGNVADIRRRELAYNGDGAPTSETIEGVEAGAAFSLAAVYTPTAEGLTGSVDRPGYGTSDVVTFTYDAARGNLLPLTRTDPLVGTTTFGYDGLNRQVSITDPNGVVTETSYDELDRVLTITRKGATPAGDLVTQHVYNNFGDLFQTIQPRGNAVEYLYDAAGRLVSSERKPTAAAADHGDRMIFALNTAGARTREERQRWTGAAWSTTTRTDWTYSTRCHLDKTIEGVAAADQATTEFAYDCNGNLEKVWDANHLSGSHPTPTTTYQYDALDRLILARQPFGGAGGGNADTTYDYDVQDHLTEVADANGTVTSYVYGDRDLMTAELSEVSGTTLSNYNEHGEIATRLDARGVLTLFDHDALDRLTRIDFPTTADIVHTWDDPLVPFGKGRLTRIAHGSEVVDYRYDRFGRTLEDGDLSYTLDANGNRTEVVYPGGMEVNTTFDFADRPATMSATPAGGSALNIVTAVTYRPFGPISSLTLGNGRIETRDFDSRDDPDRLRVSGSLLDWNYTVDKVGNPTSIADQLTPANGRTYAYQDYQYFLTTGNGPWGTRAWTYDDVGNRLSETRGAVTDTYAYTPNGASGASPLLATITSSAGNKTFDFDAAGNEVEVGTTAGPVDRDYDDAGRMTRQSFGTDSASFRYDGRGFLARITSAEPAVPGTAVFCDGFESGNTSQWGGAGVACQQEGAPTEVTYSSEGLLHTVTDAAESRNVLYFGGRPVGILRETVTRAPETVLSLRYLTTDHLGTPILATTQAGATHWVGGFEPFGADWNGAQASGVLLRFPGQWIDNQWEQGGVAAVQNLARWFSPATGRYTSRDPLGADPEGRQGEYVYVGNRPLFLNDRFGLVGSPEDCQCCTLQASARELVEIARYAREHRRKYRISKWLFGRGCGGAADALLDDVEKDIKPACWVTRSQLTRPLSIANWLASVTIGVNVVVHRSLMLTPCGEGPGGPTTPILIDPYIGIGGLGPVLIGPVAEHRLIDDVTAPTCLW